MKNSVNQRKKNYQKPEWRKEKLFERFSMACEHKTCTNPIWAQSVKT